MGKFNQLSKPEYKEGEVIVKFKAQTRLSNGQVSNIKTRANTNISLDQQAVNFSDLEEASIPPTLKNINNKYKIQKLEKVFKGVGTPKEEIAKFKQKFSQQIAKGERKINEKELLKVDLSRIHKLTFSQDVPVEQVLVELSQSPDVEYVEPNYLFKTQLVPNDPYYLDHYPDSILNRDPNWNPSYDYQWNLKKINMEQAWDISTGNNSVTVAVIDTGLDYTHPELGGCTLEQVNNNQCARIAPGYDFVNNDNDPMDDMGHGTHVGGIIGAISNNGQGISGIAQNIKIIPIKAFNEYGSSFGIDLSEAVYDATLRGARVINASWGGRGYDYALNEVINYAYLNGTIFVAAAGNSSSDTKNFYPVNYSCASSEYPLRDCVIGVGSLSQSGSNSYFSNWGEGVDVAAPGGDYDPNVVSLKSSTLDSQLTAYVVGNSFLRLSGTSMAAPHVSALAALILGRNPILTPDQVRNIVINGAVDDSLNRFNDIYLGYGIINAENSLKNMDTRDRMQARVEIDDQAFLKGGSFSLYGTAAGKDFKNYTIDYANFSYPSEGTVNGIILENNGNLPVYSGKLASVNIPNLPIGEQWYYFRLRVYDFYGNVESAMVRVRVDKEVANNFPFYFGSDPIDQKPVIADINNDGRKEIVFKNDNHATVEAISFNGQYISGWPKSSGEYYAIYYLTNTPLITDLDSGYPGLETVVPVSQSGWGNQIIAFHSDGSLVPGWTIENWINRGDIGYLDFSYMSSLNQNNENMIVYGERPMQGGATYYHLFRKDLSEFPGWPIQLPLYPDGDNAPTNSPLIADIDKDGQVEIVITYISGQKIFIYSLQGIKEREIILPITENIGEVRLADLENDGFYEIVATAFEKLPNIYQKKVYVWDYQGNIKPHWPYFIDIYSYWDSFLTIGDFDNNGEAEIMTSAYIGYNSNGKLYLLNKNAQNLPGFPYNGFRSDGMSDGVNVAVQGGKHLIAYGDSYGDVYLKEYDFDSGSLSDVSGFPKHLAATSQIASVGLPSLANFDNNGTVELLVPILVGGSKSSGRSYLYLFNLNYNILNNDWPQFLHDERHTGTYISEASIPVSPTLAPTPSCSLGPSGDLNCNGRIDVFDLTLLLGNFGSTSFPTGDLNGNGRVDVFDLTILLGNFGRSG